MGQVLCAFIQSKFQAHKIFEARAFEKVLKLEGEALKKALEKAPSIILTDAKHKEISKALNAAWKEKPPVTPADLREIYKKAYAAHPHWLEAIESYLR